VAPIHPPSGCLTGPTLLQCYSGNVGVSNPGGPWTDELIVAACPSPDGSARDGARRGKKPVGDRRKRGNPWPSCLSRA
jgi:hypothetical protein